MHAFGKTALVCLAGLSLLLALPADAQQKKVWMAWSPKPTTLTPYLGSNRPVWRLADALALHKGQASWSQDIVETARYNARLIQMAPGQKTPTQFYGDDRVVWVVWGGQIRFTIAGQKPFIATKGFLVQVPYRVAYSLETVGDTPSLRFEVTHGGRLPSFPADAGQPAPASVAGNKYIKVSYPSPPDSYTPVNRMYVDYFKDVIAAHPNDPPKQNLFVADADNLVDMIRGKGVPTPPPSNLGHFHIDNEEFWFILEGSCDYLIEGQPLLTANAGDIVFAPAGRWHRASWHDGAMDTRLSFNARPNLMHNYGPDANGKQ